GGSGGGRRQSGVRAADAGGHAKYSKFLPCGGGGGLPSALVPGNQATGIASSFGVSGGGGGSGGGVGGGDSSGSGSRREDDSPLAFPGEIPPPQSLLGYVATAAAGCYADTISGPSGSGGGGSGGGGSGGGGGGMGGLSLPSHGQLLAPLGGAQQTAVPSLLPPPQHGQQQQQHFDAFDASRSFTNLMPSGLPLSAPVVQQQQVGGAYGVVPARPFSHPIHAAHGGNGGGGG
ncbi:unnamed protein product, partial [Laminaria digitata]